jgi:branched-chain amino acid transport system substrate-binding protein
MRSGLAPQPHLVFGPYGSRPSLQALAATERVVWNHGGASSTLRWPGFPRALNVLAPASTYFRGTLEAVRSVDREARQVVILHGRTGFGADVARGAAEDAARLHFEATAIDDELAAARALLERDWRAVGFVGAGVEEVLAPLGQAREGLLGPTQWVAAAATESDEGPDVRWFLTRYRSAVGSDPPYPAAQAFAAGVLAARCLRDAEAVEDAAQLAVARSLECLTLYGNFRLDPVTGLQVGHQVLTVQWQGGARRIVWPAKYADRTLIYPRPMR